MGVLSIVAGVLLIIFGFSCLFTPLATFLSAGILVGIMFLVYGVAGIVRSFSHKAEILEWILNILAVAVGLIAMFRPGGTLVIDHIILIIIAIWFLVQGLIQITMSFREKAQNPNWYWGLIAGILGILVGILCFVNPAIPAVTVGILISFFFIESGFSLVTLGTSYNAD